VAEVFDGGDPKPEPTDHYRVPSHYTKCRGMRCQQRPVADMRRWHTERNARREYQQVARWWAYCADHLADYNREVRDDRVWWRGRRPTPGTEASS
jgi:hypothetical protein